MTPSISSLRIKAYTLHEPGPVVSAEAGVPITRWPRRLGGRGPAKRGGRSSARTVAPGAFAP